MHEEEKGEKDKTRGKTKEKKEKKERRKETDERKRRGEGGDLRDEKEEGYTRRPWCTSSTPWLRL